MTSQYKPIPFGSVSRGTLHCPDLLTALAQTLQQRLLENQEALAGTARAQQFEQLSQKAVQCDPESDEAGDVLEALFDAINVFCAPYTFFGCHPGNSSDIGFWPHQEAVDELVDSGPALPALEEAAQDVQQYFALETPEGCALYRREGTNWVQCW